MATFDIVGASDDEAASAYDRVAGDEGPQKVQANKLPLHFAGAGPLTIPGGGSATFSFNLNMQLRPDQLVIPDEFAARVRVGAFTVGAISLNAGSDPAPGDMFRASSNVRLRAAVSGTPSVPVKVTLQNRDSGALTDVSLGIAGPSKRVA